MKESRLDILTQMQAAVYAVDKDTTLTYLNPAAEKISGYSQREALGKKCWQIFGDEHYNCRQRCPAVGTWQADD